jgi:ATP-dependent helicase Lhr and Lhr-like helicase
MGAPDVGLLEQARDGTLLAGPAGERLLEGRDIFAVFVSPEEYRVIAESGRAIGQVPGENPFTPGEMLMLAGRRWRIVEVDSERRELSVRPARGGTPPAFGGDLRPPSEGVVDEMRRVWEDLSFPAYLDATAKQLLVEARTTYDRLGLRNASIARHEGQLLIFPWVGECRQQALLLALARDELEPALLGVAVAVSGEKEDALVATLSNLANSAAPDPLDLAAMIENKGIEKFDNFLGDELVTLAWARDRIDVEGLPEMALRLLTAIRPTEGLTLKQHDASKGAVSGMTEIASSD